MAEQNKQRMYYGDLLTPEEETTEESWQSVQRLEVIHEMPAMFTR